jgi:hypothetical protein
MLEEMRERQVIAQKMKHATKVDWGNKKDRSHKNLKWQKNGSSIQERKKAGHSLLWKFIRWWCVPSVLVHADSSGGGGGGDGEGGRVTITSEWILNQQFWTRMLVFCMLASDKSEPWYKCTLWSGCPCAACSICDSDLCSFWILMQRRMVIPYWRFWTTCHSHLQGASGPGKLSAALYLWLLLLTKQIKPSISA